MKNRHISLKTAAGIFALLFVTGTMLPGAAMAQCVPPVGLFQLPLNQIPVPEPPNLFEFVKNKPAAIRLGKAFFWDMQVGSDGVQACASCHFHAGVDNRRKNTINPGLRAATPDTTFQVRRPNEVLLDLDFPFHLRDNPDLQASNVIRDSNDIVGSQGVKFANFVSIVPGSAVDNCTPVLDPVFNLDTPLATDPNRNTRRVTARNTPTNINAIFNFNNFWDGRAHFTFNGVNPFGPQDVNAGVYSNATGSLVKVKVAFDLASLASQATGPPLDDIEMSCAGRTFPELGRKMLSLTPLGKQMVHPKDGVLGTLSRAVQDPVTKKITGQTGLSSTYQQMIQDAFMDKWWNSVQTVSIITRGTPTTFSQMEANFSMFWGLAVQLYEATLVSDQTPFDRCLGGDGAALGPAGSPALTGMSLFFGGATNCSACHAGTEMTTASVTAAAFITNIDNALIDQMVVANNQDSIYDNGYNNTAVRRTTDDIGREGNSPFPNPLTGAPIPLSFCTMAQLQAVGNLPFQSIFLPPQIPSTFPVSNHGAFKVPGMRNIELTAPYFHNGGDLTLEQVVDFYTRGGNFPVANINDRDPLINQLGALGGGGGPAAMAALVAFMKSLTDERVRNESAPFDHPELRIPNGDPAFPVDADGLSIIRARDENGVPAPAFAVTIDPLPARTNKTSLLVSGTKESGATAVSVKVNDGPAIPAAASSDTTWSVLASGFTGGANTITAVATDPLGSVSVSANLSVIFADGSFSGGAVNIADAVRALRIAVGLVTATADDMLHADVAPLVNGVPEPDGRIDVSDAMVILKKAVGLVSF